MSNLLSLLLTFLQSYGYLALWITVYIAAVGIQIPITLLSRFLFSALGGIINLLSGSELYPYRYFLLFDSSGEALGASIPLLLGYVFGASWEAVGDVLGYSSFLFLSLFIVIILVSRLIKNARILKQTQAINIGKVDITQSNLEEVPFGANAEISTRTTGNLPLL